MTTKKEIPPVDPDDTVKRYNLYELQTTGMGDSRNRWRSMC